MVWQLAGCWSAAGLALWVGWCAAVQPGACKTGPSCFGTLGQMPKQPDAVAANTSPQQTGQGHKPTLTVTARPPDSHRPLQFDPLSPAQLREIARLQTTELNQRLKDRSITMQLTGGWLGWPMVGVSGWLAG